MDHPPPLPLQVLYDESCVQPAALVEAVEDAGFDGGLINVKSSTKAVFEVRGAQGASPRLTLATSTSACLPWSSTLVRPASTIPLCLDHPTVYHILTCSVDLWGLSMTHGGSV